MGVVRVWLTVAVWYLILVELMSLGIHSVTNSILFYMYKQIKLKQTIVPIKYTELLGVKLSTIFHLDTIGNTILVDNQHTLNIKETALATDLEGKQLV